MVARIEDGITFAGPPIICYSSTVNTSNVEAESDANYPASNVANPSTSLKWRHDIAGSPVATTAWFRIDISSASSISYVAIAGHNFSSANIPVGLELASWNSPMGDAEIVFPPEVPADDSPLIFLFNAREVEDVRIRFEPSGSSTAAEMAVVSVGGYLEFDEGIQASHTPLPLARVADIVSGRSENGAFLGRIMTGQGLVSTATISNIETAFVRDSLTPFLDFALDNPFFWIWSPGTYPDETAFAWLTNNAVPSFDVDGYAQIDLEMRGIGS